MKLGSNDATILSKTSFNFEILETFGKGQRMIFAFDTHLTSYTYLGECFNYI